MTRGTIFDYLRLGEKLSHNVRDALYTNDKLIIFAPLNLDSEQDQKIFFSKVGEEVGDRKKMLAKIKVAKVSTKILKEIPNSIQQRSICGASTLVEVASLRSRAGHSPWGNSQGAQG